MEWSKRQKTWGYAGLLFILAFLQYSNTLQHDYALDDAIVITKNERVQKGIAGIPDLFQRFRTNRLADQYGYRPIVLSSYALEVELFGLNPHVSHFVNTFSFALLCGLLFLVLQNLFRQKSLWGVFFIILLFLAHPIHVEAVANIKGRDEILCLLFSVLSLHWGIRWVEKQQLGYYFLFVGGFLLAILSKEHAAVFAVIVPLASLYFRKPDWTSLLLLSLPLALISAWALPYPLLLKMLFFGGLLVLNISLFILRNWRMQVSIPGPFTELKQKITAWARPDSLQTTTASGILHKAVQKIETAKSYQVILLPLLGFTGLWLGDWRMLQLVGFIGLIGLYFVVIQQRELLLISLALVVVLTSFIYQTPSFLAPLYVLGLYHLKTSEQPTHWRTWILLTTVAACYGVVVGPVAALSLLLVILWGLSFNYKTLGYLLLALTLMIPFFLHSQWSILSVANLLVFAVALSSLVFRMPKWTTALSILFICFLGYTSHYSASNHLPGQLTLQEKMARQTIAINELNAYQDSVALVGLYLEDRKMGNSMIHVKSWEQKIPNSFIILSKYLRNFFIPKPLVYYYGYNQIPLTDWKDLRVYFSILIHLLMLGLAWVFFQSQRILSFALLFYLLAIAPFSHFFVALPDTMADRFMFTPSLGLCILVVAALNALLGTQLWQKEAKKKQTTRS